MTKYLSKTIVVILAVLVVSTLVAYFVYQKKILPNLISGQGDLTFIKTLKAPDGTVLGDINVVGLHSDASEPASGRDLNNVFTALYITKEVDGKSVTLYKINQDGFFNELGNDGEIVKDKFYGYQFSSINEDYFVVHLLGDNGRNISDDTIVAWNYEKGMFEIQGPP